MNRLLSLLYPAAQAAGWLMLLLASVIAGRHHPVALVVTLLVAAFFALGGWELRRFRREHQALADALDAGALDRVPDALRDAVQLRLDGRRAALPGPVLAPALTGLLVLLGMLGTFGGLALTLSGTASALGATENLTALRGALSAPLSGLGLAFATSVAGVAASAMLGLMLMLAKRERAQVDARLQAAMAGPWNAHTAEHRREQERAQLPQLLREMNAQQAAFQQAWQQEQQRFHEHTAQRYRELAESVDRSLRGALIDSARLAGEAIRPAAEAAMAGVAREATALHERTAQQLDAQLRALTDQQREASAAAQAAQLQALRDTQAWAREQMDAQQRGSAEHDAARLQSWRQELVEAGALLRQSLLDSQTAQAAQQQQWADKLLASSGQALAQSEQLQQRVLAEVQTLMHAAGEAPRAAAQMALQLREQLSSSLARDNAQLQERAQLLGTLSELQTSLQLAAGRQREAIDQLVQRSGEMLEGSTARFAEQVEARSHQLSEAVSLLGRQLGDAAQQWQAQLHQGLAQSRQEAQQLLADMAARVDASSQHLTASSTELASLGKGFSAAFEQVSSSQQQLSAQLALTEGGLAQALTRCDAQMAYTVVQARELIDLCLMSQKQILDRLSETAGA
jgi:hypothetical protein